MQEIPLERVVVPTEIENLALAPATINLAGADVELVAALSRETRLRQALAPIAAAYDFVLIDSPPSLGLLTINALTAADECIIPVQAEYYALEGLAQLTGVIWRVRDALNPTLHVSGVLVTMFDGRTRLATRSASRAREVLSAAGLQDADSAQHASLRGAVVREAGDSLRPQEPRRASVSRTCARDARSRPRGGRQA